MGATLTVNSGTSEMVRLVANELVLETMAQNIYIVPPKGEYEFMITGYALPFIVNKKPEHCKPGEPTTVAKTRVEFTIIGGKGDGRMFTQYWTYSINDRATLGKFLRKMNVDLTPDKDGNWDLDRMIGYTGTGYITPSETLDEQGKPKYPNLAIDSVEGKSPPKQAYTITLDASASTPTQPARESENSTSNGHAPATGDDGWPS
jgi:hypothetical protein